MQNPLTLLELNRLIKQTIDSNISPSYWVIAEIGDFKDSIKGHAYLELLEKSENQILAKLRANIWSYTYQGIRARFLSSTGQPIKNGMKVLALVNINFHEVYGLSANIKDIDPNFTIGERAKRKQEIIDRLSREGLLQLNKQFELPKVPQRIAVISSSTAAGYGDFINQLQHNPKGYKVYLKLFQAVMQGNEASASIISVLEQIESETMALEFDLIVIIRGGGAQTDLDCFDDYELAKAIANTTVPLITGIGHERDESIADLVANTKLKTPTAVAEFILSGFRSFDEQLKEQIKRMERVANQSLQRENKRIHELEYLLKSILRNKIQSTYENLENKKSRIASLASHKIKMHRLLLDNNHRSLLKATRSFLDQSHVKIQHLERDLKRLNPVFFLERGYTRSEINGRSIQNVEYKNGDNLITYTLHKRIQSEIKSIEDYV